MFASILRSAMFISLMLIVTVTLSGCANLQNICSGIKSCVGNVADAVGGCLQAGVNACKQAVPAVEKFLNPVVNGCQQVISCVDGVCTTIGNACQTVQQAVTPTTNTRQRIVSSRDSEEAVAATANKNQVTDWLNSVVSGNNKTGQQASGNTTLSLNSEVEKGQEILLTDSEKKEAQKKIKGEAAEVKAAMEKLGSEISSLSNASSNDLDKAQKNLKTIQGKLNQIMNDPLNEKSTQSINDVAKEIEEMLNIATKYEQQAKALGDSIVSVVETCKESFESMEEDLSKAFSGIKNLF